jgi:hypothetical protein
MRKLSNVKVTKEQIDEILANSQILFNTVFNKCTLMVVELPNGFILTESSACVDPENYDEKLGYEICLERIANKLWELEGYVLQSKVNEGTTVLSQVEA